MKKFRTLAALLMIALMTTALAACGGGSSAGVKKGEEFSVGEYNMMYDSAATDGSEASVTVLLKGKTGLPVAFNNGNMSIIINAKLGEGDNVIKASKLAAEGLKDEVTEDEYGAKITYTFENIGDADYSTATIYLMEDESQCAVLDFKSGLGESSTSGGGSSAGMIIAIVLVALAIAGGVFAWKKGFFKKDPGPGAAGMPPAMGEPVTPGTVSTAVPGAAPFTPAVPASPTPAPAAAPFTPAAAPAVEPAPAAAPAAPAPAPEPDPVTFVETVKGDDGVSTYEVYKGPDKASAVAFLRTKTVDRENYFIVVDTPEGNFGRDIQGLYQE